MMPSDRGTPPDIVHSTPVPAQVMHSSTLRRCIPRLSSLLLDSVICISPALCGRTDVGETGRESALFPEGGSESREAITLTRPGIDLAMTESCFCQPLSVLVEFKSARAS